MKASIRAMEPEDVDILYRWENDPAIWSVSSTLAPVSRFVLEQYIADSMGRDVFEAGQLRLIIEDDADGTPIGVVDLFDIDVRDGHGSIGISINDAGRRGRGYAADALRQFVRHCFDIIGLHSLLARIDTDNEASIHLFETCGFARVGMLRQWHKTPQGWKDQLEMQIINN